MLQDDSNHYINSFNLLTKDYLLIHEYIDPSDSNLHTYSHRNYELLLRLCTEFENLCKEKIIEKGCTKQKEKLKINDFKVLDSLYNLSNIELGLLYWNTKNKFVRPFVDWGHGKNTLQWYDAYNKVKHNRIENFSMANLENITNALSGLFLLCYKIFGLKLTQPNSYGVSHGNPRIDQVTNGNTTISTNYIYNTFYVIRETRLIIPIITQKIIG